MSFKDDVKNRVSEIISEQLNSSDLYDEIVEDLAEQLAADVLAKIKSNNNECIKSIELKSKRNRSLNRSASARHSIVNECGYTLNNVCGSGERRCD